MAEPVSFLDGRVTLYVGDCMAQLATMEPDSVDCVVTSPPYWGLRDYGTATWEGGDVGCPHVRVDTRRTAWANSVKGPGNPGKNGTSYANMTKEVGGRCANCGAVNVDQQIGLEPTLGEHLAVMVRVFEAVGRVLKPTGTCWINYGDCYATSPNGRSAADTKATGNDDRTFRDKPFSTIGAIYQPDDKRANGRNVGKNSYTKGETANGRVVAGGILKAKDLCMVPNRLAIALQEAGWWVRSEIVWAKPNPMPESIRDRPATSHEKIFLLTKAARYWYDAEAVRQPSASNGEYKTPDGWDTGPGAHGSVHRQGRQKGESVAEKRQKQAQTAASAAAVGGSSGRRMAGFNARWDAKEKRNENANGFGGSYVEGQPGPRQQTGNVPGTNDRNLRNYEPAPVEVWNIATQPFSEAHFATFPTELAERCILAGCPKGGLVLDPFGGAGTTALVALRHHRRAALIELNPAYAEMAQGRIEAEWRVPARPKLVDHGPLFGTTAA